MDRSFKLKLFLSISLGVHLSVLSLLSNLMPNFKSTQLPRPNIEISFIPPVNEERELPQKVENKEKVWSSAAPIKSGELAVQSEEPLKIVEKKETEIKTEVPVPVEIYEETKSVQAERVENTIPKKQEEPLTALTIQSDVKVVSIRESKSSRLQSDKPLIESKQEEKVVVASLGNPFPPISSSEKSHSVIPPKADPPLAGRPPSLSEGEILFARPRYAENPKPLYPQEARKRGYEGEVLLRVEVLSNGWVGEIEVKRSSGHDILDRSAIQAVKQWKFVPAQKGETPVSVWVIIPVIFQLR